MSLYEIIKAVQDAPKKGGLKLAILLRHKDNELLQAYLKAVYDPRITYGMKKVIDIGKEAGSDVFDESTIEKLLDTIASRKLTGYAASNFVKIIKLCLNVEGQELLDYIIKRDIRAGVSEGTILKVWPDLFFIPPYQRCSSMDAKAKERFGLLPYFFVQTKNDGQFSYLIKRSNGASESMSRAGSLYPSWLPEKLSVGVPSGFVLAGEMLVYENGVMLNRQEGNGVLNSVLSGDGKKFNPATMEVKYVAWDMLTEAEFTAGKSNRPYRERLDMLSVRCEYQAKNVRIVNHWNVRSIAEAASIQNEHLARKEEGTVWKDPDMLWRDCSSGDPMMVKAKLVFEADFKITGMYEGEGKYAGMLGGFNVATSDDLIVFNVGSGFSDDQRKEFWELGEDYFIGKVAAVEGNDIVTSEGKTTESVFLPIFIEVRSDKTVADSRERVWQQFNAERGL